METIDFMTGDETKLSAPDWAKIQAAWFPLVESTVITQESEVTAQSLADYFQKKCIDPVVKEAFEKANPPVYTPIF